jgi:hypothetical protein
VGFGESIVVLDRKLGVADRIAGARGGASAFLPGFDRRD